jgi:hypothetical protein
MRGALFMSSVLRTDRIKPVLIFIRPILRSREHDLVRRRLRGMAESAMQARPFDVHLSPEGG